MLEPLLCYTACAKIENKIAILIRLLDIKICLASSVDPCYDHASSYYIAWTLWSEIGQWPADIISTSDVPTFKGLAIHIQDSGP